MVYYIMEIELFLIMTREVINRYMHGHRLTLQEKAICLHIIKNAATLVLDTTLQIKNH